MRLNPNTSTYDVLDAVATATNPYTRPKGLDLQWYEEDGDWDIDTTPIQDALEEDYSDQELWRSIDKLEQGDALDIEHNRWPNRGPGDIGTPSIRHPETNITRLVVTGEGYKELYEGMK